MLLNVSSDEDWSRLAEEVYNRFGKIDILVNNAGISSETAFSDIGIDEWQRLSSIYGFGPFAGMKRSYLIWKNSNREGLSVSHLRRYKLACV